MTIVVLSFLFFLGIFIAIGVSSARAKKTTTDDYLLADRNVPPWLASLSAVATNNSGFMFIGMIAYTYRLGIEAVWMMVGWVLGDLTAPPPGLDRWRKSTSSIRYRAFWEGQSTVRIVWWLLLPV